MSFTFKFVDLANRTLADQTTYYTNPANGNTIIDHSAGQTTSQLISNNPDGGHTELDTFIGLPEQIRTAQGPVLTRDAGYAAFLNTFDGSGNLVSSQIVIDRGPHPDAESNFTLFCTVATSALGL